MVCQKLSTPWQFKCFSVAAWNEKSTQSSLVMDFYIQRFSAQRHGHTGSQYIYIYIYTYICSTYTVYYYCYLFLECVVARQIATQPKLCECCMRDLDIRVYFHMNVLLEQKRL